MLRIYVKDDTLPLPAVAAAAAATSQVKFAYVAAASLIASIGGWLVTLNAQVEGNSATETIIPAAALTATSGALVWVVKQIVGGSLVHRDPARAETVLAEAVTKLVEVHEASARREETLTNLLLERLRD